MRQADAARDSRSWEIAVKLYSRAVAADPTRAAAWVQLGNCAKEARQFDLASSAYGHALSLEPNNSDTYLQLGHLKKITGNVFDALWAYSRSINFRDSDDANREIGEILTAFELIDSRLALVLRGRRFAEASIGATRHQDLNSLLKGSFNSAGSHVLKGTDISTERRVSLMRFTKILTRG